MATMAVAWRRMAWRRMASRLARRRLGWRGGPRRLAAGALLAAPYAYGYGYGPYGYGCGSYYQPMYDAYGRYIGQQLVNAC